MRPNLPTAFHSSFDGPFDRCRICDCDLTEPGTVSIVLKYMHTRRDTEPESIVEFAACLPCLQTKVPPPSEQSLEAIVEFRVRRMRERPPVQLPPSDGVPDCCEMCGRPTDDCRTFSMRAEVEADEDSDLRIIMRPSLAWMTGSPAMMCDDCNTQLAESISQQTRDGWDRFYDDYIDDTPQLAADGPRPLLV